MGRAGNRGVWETRGRRRKIFLCDVVHQEFAVATAAVVVVGTALLVYASAAGRSRKENPDAAIIVTSVRILSSLSRLCGRVAIVRRLSSPGHYSRCGELGA